MELVFPFKNMAINSVWDYFEIEKIDDFNAFKSGKESWKKEFFYNEIERWRNYLPNFENEMLQIINTTDQKTIDEYFNTMNAQFTYLKDTLTEDFFNEKVHIWNTEALKKYEALIEKETEEYFKQENRKMNHLEQYDDFKDSIWMTMAYPYLKPEKQKRINYNFYCIEKTPETIGEEMIPEYISIVDSLINELFEFTDKYCKAWEEGKIKSRIEEQLIPKPIIFVEGEIDKLLIIKAAELLNKTELLKKIELRQRNGFPNLDKLWNIFKSDSWETIPQKKIFLYDCDTKKENEDFLHHYKRVIPTNPDSIIKSGIENLFPNDFIHRAASEKGAFLDYEKTTGTNRGAPFEKEEYKINKSEKTNFCNWACKYGNEADFKNFNAIFEIIESIVL